MSPEVKFHSEPQENADDNLVSLAVDEKTMEVVFVSDNQLGVIFENLVLNGLKFNREGKAEITIVNNNIPERISIIRQETREGLLNLIAVVPKRSRLRTLGEGIYDSVPFAMSLVYLDVDGTYKYGHVNEAYAELRHKEQSDIIEQRVKDVWKKDVYEKHIKPCLDKAFAGERVHVHYTVESKGGKKYYELLMKPLLIKNEKKIRHVSVILRDETEVLLAEELVRTNTAEVISIFAATIETRFGEEKNHVPRVARYAELIAKEYGLSEQEIEQLKLASTMHDIGKIGIGDEILMKKGKLLAEEFEKIKEHSALGNSILSKSENTVIQTAAKIALQHHERWDGSGYPQKLIGANIDISARIVAIADVFDALLSKRAYKEAWAQERAIEEIQKCSGTHFDPDLVNCFLRISDIQKVREEFPDTFSEQRVESEIES